MQKSQKNKFFNRHFYPKQLRFLECIVGSLAQGLLLVVVYHYTNQPPHNMVIFVL